MLASTSSSPVMLGLRPDLHRIWVGATESVRPGNARSHLGYKRPFLRQVPLTPVCELGISQIRLIVRAHLPTLGPCTGRRVPTTGGPAPTAHLLRHMTTGTIARIATVPVGQGLA